MAHLICEYDNMVSVHETPWHGLGIVLDAYPTVKEAQNLSGLTFHVRKDPAGFIDSQGNFVPVPNSFITVREDIELPLGVVGNNYEAFQNEQMFDFIENFVEQAGSKIETCGSLRNGRTVWALAHAGSVEFVKNDPVNKFFLFKNAFDGSSAVEICFTDVRVVCNNTLSMALSGATNAWRVRHTAAMRGQLDVVGETLFRQQEHGEKMAEIMAVLSRKSLSSQDILQTIINTVVLDTTDIDLAQSAGTDIFDEMSTQQKNTIDKIIELVESGAGMDLPGVRGTAYGLLQAVIEYADHFRTIRATEGRTKKEARFESIFMGAAADFKSRAFNNILALAA